MRLADLAATWDGDPLDGFLDPAVIGAAVGRYDPQALKRVWHYVARFGRPA